jgi:hypothetical protein
MADEDERLMLTFKKPPIEYGFQLSKSGKCYWLVTNLDRARQIGAELAEMGIHGRIKRLDPVAPRRNNVTRFRRRPAGSSPKTGSSSKSVKPLFAQRLRRFSSD